LRTARRLKSERCLLDFGKFRQMPFVLVVADPIHGDGVAVINPEPHQLLALAQFLRLESIELAAMLQRATRALSRALRSFTALGGSRVGLRVVAGFVGRARHDFRGIGEVEAAPVPAEYTHCRKNQHNMQ
jgi:hypothetical protein